MIFPSLLKHQRYNFLIFFSVYMGAIRYSCPIRVVPTCILPSKERKLLGKFQPASFKTKRLACVKRTDRRDGHGHLLNLKIQKMIFPIVYIYVTKHGSYNLFHIIFPPIFRSFLWQLYYMVVRFS